MFASGFHRTTYTFGDEVTLYTFVLFAMGVVIIGAIVFRYFYKRKVKHKS